MIFNSPLDDAFGIKRKRFTQGRFSTSLKFYHSYNDAPILDAEMLLNDRDGIRWGKPSFGHSPASS